MTETVAARDDFEQRIHERSDSAGVAIELPPPVGLRAEPGVGHIRLDWEAVPGAAGYVIERRAGTGEATILRHGGSDVAAVPRPPFASTGIEDGVDYTYRVGSVANAGSASHSFSAEVSAASSYGNPGPIEITVDAREVTGKLDRVWWMVGSERLSQLLLTEVENGHDIAEEFLEALRIAHEDLGVTHVRAHAIFHDDLGVVSRSPNGEIVYDFARIDAIYDTLYRLGLRPIVELSFMPAVLARDPEKTVFTYRAIISPPKDFGEWHDLVSAFTAHLVDRYGLEEVSEWAFEVWNEANLGVFWTGSKEEYLRLYAEAARAVKAVSERLRVGGPSSAADEWVEELAAYARHEDLPLDFVSTHTYGNQPLDLRPALARHGFGGVPLWWTEWGAGSTHFGAIHDSVAGAPFILHGYAAAQGRVEALSYWVVSDHFEELGRPPRLFHDGFGLLSVGNLRKPRYWAVHLAAHQGKDRLATTVEGDGAEVLVGTSATIHEHGTIDVLVWNGTINSEVMGGDPRLDRRVQLALRGLAATRYEASLARVDATHSNVVAKLPAGVEWPDEIIWKELYSGDVLDEEQLPTITPVDGVALFEFEVPQPGVARLRLEPG